MIKDQLNYSNIINNLINQNNGLIIKNNIFITSEKVVLDKLLIDPHNLAPNLSDIKIISNKILQRNNLYLKKIISSSFSSSPPHILYSFKLNLIKQIVQELSRMIFNLKEFLVNREIEHDKKLIYKSAIKVSLGNIITQIYILQQYADKISADNDLLNKCYLELIEITQSIIKLYGGRAIIYGGAIEHLYILQLFYKIYFEEF